MNFRILEESEELVVEVVEKHMRLPERIEAEVDFIWNNAVNSGVKLLFNNPMLSLVTFRKGLLIAEFVQYKHFYAQLIEPKLKFYFNIRPLCISGCIQVKNNFLLGQRSGRMAQYPNCYEFAPSGGIDASSMVDGKVDIVRQFRSELEQELGVTDKQIDAIRPLIVCEDQETGVVEILGKIELDPSVLQKKDYPIEEYNQLFWLTRDALKEHIALHRDFYVPTSLFIYRTLIDNS